MVARTVGRSHGQRRGRRNCSPSVMAGWVVVAVAVLRWFTAAEPSLLDELTWVCGFVYLVNRHSDQDATAGRWPRSRRRPVTPATKNGLKASVSPTPAQLPGGVDVTEAHGRRGREERVEPRGADERSDPLVASVVGGEGHHDGPTRALVDGLGRSGPNASFRPRATARSPGSPWGRPPPRGGTSRRSARVNRRAAAHRGPPVSHGVPRSDLARAVRSAAA